MSRKRYTIEDIRRLRPCYDPVKYLPKDWSGTLADILDVDECPAEDRIWAVVQLMDKTKARLFAVWCAREALKLIDNPDPRVANACDVAERYALGNASAEEMGDACAAVRAARESAVFTSAEYAVRAAAFAANDDATRCVVVASAYAAAYAAVYAVSVAYDAAYVATLSACVSADAVAVCTPEYAMHIARLGQIKKLREMICRRTGG